MGAMSQAKLRPRFTLRPLSRTTSIVLGIVVAVIVAFVLLFEWNWLRRPVEYVV